MHHGLKILAACVYNLIGLHILLFTTAALTYCTTKGYTSSSTSHFPATTRGLSPFSPSFSSSSPAPVMGYTVYTIQHRNPIILDVEWEPSLLISSIGINNKRQKKKLSIPHTHTDTPTHVCWPVWLSEHMRRLGRLWYDSTPSSMGSYTKGGKAEKGKKSPLRPASISRPSCK